MRSPHRADGGAAAVELAIVLPLLLLLLFGIIDFGRLLNAQLTVSAAAREGARWVALGHSSGLGARVIQAAPGLTPAPTATALQSCSATSSPTDNARVDVSVVLTTLTPISAIANLMGGALPSTFTIVGHGVMRCGG